jgi:glutamyl-tRNA synthetase
MSAVLRFAPSPTGRLHVGNARVALVNWLYARRAGGRFLLRLDDTDAERSSEEFARAIEDDLRWLGLDYEGPWRQSARRALYDAALERLKAAGRAYPCYETLEELEFKRRRAVAQGRPPVYDRAALGLTDDERRALEGAGRVPHWRFRLDEGALAWTDLVHGPLAFAVADLGDPVLVRSDGRPLFTFSSVVDDIDLGVTHVIRGDDHISNTAVQCQIYEALGAALPVFGHLPLLVDASGRGLSKREGDLTVAHLRASGIEAMALVSYLAKIGTSDPPEPRYAMADVVADFDIAKFSPSPLRFDEASLLDFNASYVHRVPFSQVKERLSKAFGIDPTEEFWNAVRGNLATVEEAAIWWNICFKAISPVIDDEDFCRRAAEMLPPEPWNGDTWGHWTRALAEATGRKGRTLYHPLRLALTGRADGPELRNLLPLIGKSRATSRLLGQRA